MAELDTWLSAKLSFFVVHIFLFIINYCAFFFFLILSNNFNSILVKQTCVFFSLVIYLIIFYDVNINSLLTCKYFWKKHQRRYSPDIKISKFFVQIINRLILCINAPSISDMNDAFMFLSIKYKNDLNFGKKQFSQLINSQCMQELIWSVFWMKNLIIASCK